MSAYADTGFICSLYAPDAPTERAISRMDKQREAIRFTWLNQVEFRNALRLRVFRNEITPPQRDASINFLMADLTTGVFAFADPAQSSVLIEAERLSSIYSERLGTRSLDILHVAMAIVLGSACFLSFDTRQINLAKAVGLDVPKL